MVITTAQLHSTKPKLRFCTGSNPARDVSEIRDGEDLRQWSRLEIRLNAFRPLTIPQKQFIIIIIIIMKKHKKVALSYTKLTHFQPMFPFYIPPKNRKRRFSDVFRGYSSGILVEYELRSFHNYMKLNYSRHSQGEIIK